MVYEHFNNRVTLHNLLTQMRELGACFSKFIRLSWEAQVVFTLPPDRNVKQKLHLFCGYLPSVPLALCGSLPEACNSSQRCNVVRSRSAVAAC